MFDPTEAGDQEKDRTHTLAWKMNKFGVVETINKNQDPMSYRAASNFLVAQQERLSQRPLPDSISSLLMQKVCSVKSEWDISVRKDYSATPRHWWTEDNLWDADWEVYKENCKEKKRSEDEDEKKMLDF